MIGSVVVAVILAALLAQQPEPAKPVEPVKPPEAAAAPSAATEPQPPPKLEFTGKPIAVPFACTDETLHAVGLACPESEPCPVFLELAALESSGGKLFLAGNLHSSATTFSSIFLASEDYGKSWIEAHERLPQAVIENLQFVDFSNGWAAGQTLAQLPRDPFFLVTEDGGKTWRKRPMFDETRVAAIDSFYFDSRTDGSMVLDRSRGGEPNARYELYETKTGGDTWMLREVSGKPLKLKKMRIPLADLRLRADGPSKSYRIEQLRNGRWSLLASFLVRLPDCKIGAKELAPPPDPEPEPEKPAPPKSPGRKTPPSLKKKSP